MKKSFFGGSRAIGGLKLKSGESAGKERKEEIPS